VSGSRVAKDCRDLLEIKTSCQDHSKSSEPLIILFSQFGKVCSILVQPQTELCKVNKYLWEDLHTIHNCDDFDPSIETIGSITFASNSATDGYRGEFVRLYLQNFNIDCTIQGVISSWTMTQSMWCKSKPKESELTVTSQ